MKDFESDRDILKPLITIKTRLACNINLCKVIDTLPPLTFHEEVGDLRGSPASS